MKKYLPLSLLLLLTLTVASCQKPGKISGNVFWKYNDYVGNKPDAGADVWLYDEKDGKLVDKVKADVQGNYQVC